MGQVNDILRRTSHGYMFYCPGCERPHAVRTEGVPSWGFDGNTDAPTFSPSILVTYNGPDASVGGAPPAVCHSFVRGGRIEFLTDCTHGLAGQTVPLPALPAEYRDRA